MRTLSVLHRHRHALIGLLGLGSIGWLLARSVSKPQRLSYPCQQAALAQTLGALAYLAPLAGAAHLLARLRRRTRLGWSGALGLFAAFVLAAASGQVRVAPAHAATGDLPFWTSTTAKSNVFVVDDVPAAECSLDGGVLPSTGPCNDPDYALRDRGVERLLSLMESHGTHFHRTAAHVGIVGSDSVVVLKINNQWGGEGSGNGVGRMATNTDVLKGVIWAILQHPDGFTGEVVVAENTQGVRAAAWDVTPANAQDQNQSYQDVVGAFQSLGRPVSFVSWDALNDNTIRGGAVNASGYPAGEFARGNNDDAYILLNDPAAGSGADQLSYPKFTTTGGNAVSMRYGVWNGSAYSSQRLTFINLPILKRHGMAGATIAWKNLVGFQTNADTERRFVSWDLMHDLFWGYTSDSTYGLIGRELALVRAPDLNIVDAIWAATEGNTGGVAVREDVLAASTDPFAVDWYTSEYVLRDAMGSGMPDEASAARAGTFRTATRVNQSAARAVWPGGATAFPYMVFRTAADAASIQAEHNQMNVYGASFTTPSLAISDATVTEGHSGPVSADLTVTLVPAPASAVTIPFSTEDGTATAGADYEATTGTLTFAAGVGSQTISVSVYGDTADEPNETFLVSLSPAAGVVIVEDRQAVVTIADDDPAPTISISDVSLPEGQTGTTPAVFTVHLSDASGQRITAAWSTANGTAVAASDYVAASGTLTFAPGQTSRTLSVAVRGDQLDEADETFLVNLGAVTNAEISDGQGQGTIADDDALPGLSVNDVSTAEGNQGLHNAVFTARLSKASGREVVVACDTWGGDAEAGTDYAATTASLTFAPGVLTRTVAVPVRGDTVDEPNETYGVHLSGAVNAEILDGDGTGTIVDDDAAPVARVAALTVTEGHAGTAAAVMAVSLSSASARAVTLDWATANGTARAPSDYDMASGSLYFAPGAVSQTIAVPVRGDVFVEPDETVNIKLSRVVNATASASPGVLTIRNDDAAVQFGAASSSVAEGGTATVTVTRTGALATTVTADYATANGSATAVDDYLAAAGTLTFGPGVKSQAFSVTTLADPVGEADETVSLLLANPSAGATLDVRPVATLKILDDDVRVRLSASAYRVAEGGAATITVQRAGSTAAGLTVGYGTTLVGGGATAEDFTQTSGTLTFAAGQTSASFTVRTAPDTLDENDEVFGVALTGAALAGAPVPVVLPASASVTIVDNDSGGALQLSAASYSIAEGGGHATIAVTRSGGLASAVTVDYSTSDGTATWDGDYSAVARTLTFNAGQTQRTFTVDVTQDAIGEGNETFSVQLANPQGGATLGKRTSAPVTIVDDDAYVQIAAASYSVVEGGTVAVAFRRVGASAAGVSLSYQVVGESADSSDYSTVATGTLSFAAGQMTRVLSIAALQDALVETPETLRVEITDASPAIGLPRTATVTIQDDDRYPANEIVFVTEGSSFAPVLTLRAAATVLWTWDDGTTSSELNPSKDYGSEGRRANHLQVTPWSAVRAINIGYDAGDGGSGEIEMVPDQHVREVYGLARLAPYLERWCSSYNDIESLSFDNFVVLDTIECFLSRSLKKVSLRNTPKLHRACFEDCDLAALDLSESPALEDLRGATNAYPGITFAAKHSATWHVCIRDNSQFTNRSMFSNAARFPRIAELFIWNTNQAGALHVHSSSTTRSVAILAAGNAYTSADFTGAMQNAMDYAMVDLSGNQLGSITVAGCVQLSNLNLSNNPLSSSAIDKLLAELDELGTSNGSAELLNTAPPGVAGLAHRANLLARGWTVNVDAP